jgi:hypothetical protein
LNLHEVIQCSYQEVRKMKLLRVRASRFKNCNDNFIIDMVAKSKKTSEDKEYELQEIAPGLFVFSTTAFVGKNASGKTTAIELLDCCYTILGEFRLESKNNDYENVALEIIFYHEGLIYRYETILQADSTLGNQVVFTEQHIYSKRYYKSRVKTIYEHEGFDELDLLGVLPEDTAKIFFVLKKKLTRAVYFKSDGEGLDTYKMLFRALKNYQISNEVLSNIIQIFDDNIHELNMVDDQNFSLVFKGESRHLSDKELIRQLSSGTTKGILLYTMVIASLKFGFDLLIDEIENHFHKTLVDNLISLYKDKSVNHKNASLIFTTHYCEVLDLFNRQDNIWITKSNDSVYLDNMYDHYHLRPELLKSKLFYNNAFNTAVNYEKLMKLKKNLKQ